MNPVHLLPAALISLILLSSAQAATVAHWRFEGDSSTWLLDSSGNGNHLTNGGNGTSYVLPTSGAGSAFSDPIPQTGTPNLRALSFIGGGTGLLRAPDSPAWTTPTFTIEAQINLNAVGALQSIAGHFSGASDPLTRALLFHVNSSNNLSVIINNNTFSSTLNLSAGTDYFVALAVDLTAPESQRLTFYLQDLTNGGTLQQSVRSANVTSVNNTTADFSIGSTGNPSSPFNGLIDEVRFSNSTLTANQLLIAPEPSRSLFLCLGLGLVFTHRRRNSLK
ncbi:LamG domain-containing protein [Phragmitibacter flavus]|uniref:LamG domain-containing protein n=1 Tax=Phragmitibacter flavus TaxID=2576071 RepID=A0A5R8K7A4_9BACT|nr:LamG domain-containing protein [Phragmitibacter flavus]TLD68248.1 LamG domain-containing protein [Phragmitibacter flavus]